MQNVQAIYFSVHITESSCPVAKNTGEYLQNIVATTFIQILKRSVSRKSMCEMQVEAEQSNEIMYVK